jgi:uncharacterized membrane protein
MQRHGVRSIWLRNDLETFKKQLKALEAKSAQEDFILTEAQLKALETAREEKQAHGAQDTFYVGTLKGVGRVYQQTFLTQIRGLDRPEKDEVGNKC